MVPATTRPIFNSTALVRLKEALSSGKNVNKYLAKQFIINPTDTVESKQKMPKSTVSLSGASPAGKKRGSDSVDDAIALFEAYSNLSLQDASDERFWAYLTHVDFFDYMKKRTNLSAQSPKKRTKYVLDHWFVDPVSPASLMNNDIARLWWVVYLTRTDKGVDPYELTREVFSMLDYTTHLLPGSQGRNRDIRHAVLRFIIQHRDIFKTNKEAKVRFLMRKVNMMGGYTVLSAMTENQIQIFLTALIPQLILVKKK